MTQDTNKTDKRKEIQSESTTTSPYIESEESRDNMRAHLRTIEVVHTTPNEIVPLRKKIKNALVEFTSIMRRRGLRIALFSVGCWIDRSKLYDSIATYDNQGQYELEYKCKRDFTGIKVAVYSAVYGGYDDIKEPEFVSSNFEYIIFTDSEIPDGSVWRRGNTSQIKGFEKMDAYHKSKYIKVHPHQILTDYDYSIWIDGNTKIVGDVIPLIDRIGDNAIAMYEHPHRDCIFTEGNALIYYNRASSDLIRRQLKAYRKSGMPRHYGLNEATVIIRRHNDSMCREIMEEWWGELMQWSMRDQISLQYILWRKGLKHAFIYSLGSNIKFNPRFEIGRHKHS